jgi:hypothetical protein
MNAKFLPSILIVFFSMFAASGAFGEARTMLTLPNFPVAGLKSYLPQDSYTKLINEPIKACIILRGQIIDWKVAGAHVVKSEANGVYDKASVQIANGMWLETSQTGSRIPHGVVVYVLIYQLPKGEHAFAFAQDDSLGDSNLIFSRSIRMRYLGLANAKPTVTAKKGK